MRPTEILSAEHRVIERVLDCLDRIAARATEREVLDVRSTQNVLRVLRTFADACHHGKEEKLLFPRMEARGMPRHVGPLAVMLEEHELGRRAVRALTEAVEAVMGGNKAGIALFAHHAREFTDLLRDHIAKEDEILFPMAESMFTAEDRAQLLKAFESVEHDDVGPGVHEEMLALVEGLCRDYQVPAKGTSGTTAHVCGHAKQPGV